MESPNYCPRRPPYARLAASFMSTLHSPRPQAPPSRNRRTVQQTTVPLSSSTHPEDKVALTGGHTTVPLASDQHVAEAGVLVVVVPTATATRVVT
ncbi:hypothetical protein EXIGLDRAFT_334985 [Exidia glandulosa HHB12029]|uniref:Uncharacterized protein n=1 Tax=Exidia glandulosa HHB12029 TaxID=1314781 RepID=A0A165CMW4_EXIGL|nr:hypothetical protein EXIGLDRAFT_334985 [Exidia glandulosa HHB12029]